jgi:ATP-dependent Zn protease
MKPAMVLIGGVPLMASTAAARAVLAQAGGPQTSSGLMVYALSWLLPVLIILGMWFWVWRRFMGKKGRSTQYLDRCERHMTEVEEQLKRIVTLLEEGRGSK